MRLFVSFVSSQLKHNPTGLLNAGAGDRRITELNKTFLQNTIRSVESHNRREVCESHCLSCSRLN